MTARPDTASTDVEHGLTAAEVAERVADGRTNDVPLRASRTVWEIVRANVFTRINAIFGVLFLIIVSTGYLLDGMFGLLILANSLVGMIQELRAKRTLDELSIVGQARPRVRRDGVRGSWRRTRSSPTTSSRWGPATRSSSTGRSSTGEALEVDESLLTGESDPVVKEPGDGGALRQLRGGRERRLPGHARSAGTPTPRSSPRRPASSRWSTRSCATGSTGS